MTRAFMGLVSPLRVEVRSVQQAIVMLLELIMRVPIQSSSVASEYMYIVYGSRSIEPSF